MADSLSSPSSTGAQGLKLTDLLAPIQPLLGRIEERLRAEANSFLPDLQPAVHQVLEAGGKRLRPLMTLLSGQATGGVREEHIVLATTLEIFHTATLVHDDILDGAEFRRMLPTAKAVLGSEVSVLLGDALFAHALTLAASFPDVRICREVADAANKVCSGEILQTFSRKNLDLTFEAYILQLKMKTAALFEVAGRLGAFLNLGDHPATEAMGRFGSALGIAYQLYDDCLDLFGEENSAGKSLGTDAETGKLTLPILYAIRDDNQDVARRLRAAIAGEERLDATQLRTLVSQTDAPGLCGTTVRGYLDEAESQLLRLPHSDAQSSLRQLLLFIGQRVELLLSS